MTPIVNKNYLNVELQEVILASSKASGISIEQITGRSRKKDVVIGRHVYHKLAREMTNYSTLKIGGVSKKNHATVLHSLKNMDWSLDEKNKDTYSKHVRYVYRVAEKMILIRCENIPFDWPCNL